MKNFRAMNLLELMKNNSEEFVQNWLENFSCSKNPDVEKFIRKNSISFAKQYLSAVWLVFYEEGEEQICVGYFALINKHFQVDLSKLSKTLAKRVQKFATFEETLNRYVVSAPLIGQLGKNYFTDITNSSPATKF